MDIAEPCVDLQAVKKAYPKLFTNNSAPSPHSHRVQYLATNDDGELSFTFKVEAAHLPYCLVGVGFKPRQWKSNPVVPE